MMTLYQSECVENGVVVNHWPVSCIMLQLHYGYTETTPTPQIIKTQHQ